MVPNGQSDNPELLLLRRTLASETTPLARRFRALFALKHIACENPPTPQTLPAIDAIAVAFGSPSALLKHELAYCLGQTRNPAAVPYLRAALQDDKQDAICRHEAAEALAALGDMASLPLLEAMRDTEGQPEAVRETCEIAVDKLRWDSSDGASREKIKKSDFTSIDPAPPLSQDEISTTVAAIPELTRQLLDRTLPLFRRYRAMFTLRDLASPPDLPTAVPAVEALARGFEDKSALFRHEIAFVFGQLTHPASIPSLIRTLSNPKEEGMVRHEAAEALGSLGSEQGVDQVLESFINDREQLVKDSIVVALDMAEFEKNGELEYTLSSETAVS